MILGFLIIISQVNTSEIDLGNSETYNPDKEESNFGPDIPRSSSIYYLNSVVIDDNGGGDYTWAEAELEPWCSGSGSG